MCLSGLEIPALSEGVPLIDAIVALEPVARIHATRIVTAVEHMLFRGDAKEELPSYAGCNTTFAV